MATVAVWGAGTPVATAIAEGLRRHDFEATAIAGLRRRPGGAHRSVIFPVWDGRPPEEPGTRRTRLLEETAVLLAALEDGQLHQLTVISSAAAYGIDTAAEDDALGAAEGDTFAADAVAVETRLGTADGSPSRPGLTVLRPAHLLGPGMQGSLLSRHLAGTRLLVVRGTSPMWQMCHVDDLTAALALLLADSGATPVLDHPVVVASAGVLNEAGLEAAAGRRRMELPAMVAEATAARLRRTKLSPAAPDELPLLTHPVVVEPVRLPGLGFVAGHDAAGAVRAHLLATRSTRDEPVADPSSLPSGQHAATLAGATVAVVGSAALLRRARRQRGWRAG